MGVGYLIRLDDACPTMRRDAWDRLETVLDELDVRPIVGVIPDCAPSELRFADPDPMFWDGVRRWQAKGWTIAAHGLHHVPHPDPPGHRSLVPFHRSGEFVGLDLARQRAILAEAIAIFRAEDVRPTMFMPPRHSFDETTLAALKADTDLDWITDGISFRPFERHGLRWAPQQVHRFRWFLPPGLWTVSLHPNVMTEREIDDFVLDLRRRRRQVLDPADIADRAPAARSWPDAAFEWFYWSAIAVRRPLGQALRRMKLR